MSRQVSAVQAGESVPQLKEVKEEIESLKSQSAVSFDMPIDQIMALRLPDNMQQPRLYFDPHKMELLKESIAKHGVLEPILVRPASGSSGALETPDSLDQRFELISGERRWRCCRSLKLKTIPAIVRQMSDSMALEAAIIAHLLSEEISLIEQTESILSLLSLRLGLSTEALKGLLYQVKNSQMRGTAQARAFSEQQIAIVNSILSEFGIKLSSFVANRLPLLNLSPPILSSVRAGKLSPTNALLVNRQPNEFHQTLVSQAEGKTKGELASLIKETVSPNKTSDKPANKLSDKTSAEARAITQQIYGRMRSVSKKPNLLDNPEAMHRLAQINKLLQEIESLDR